MRTIEVHDVKHLLRKQYGTELERLLDVVKVARRIYKEEKKSTESNERKNPSTHGEVLRNEHTLKKSMTKKDASSFSSLKLTTKFKGSLVMNREIPNTICPRKTLENQEKAKTLQRRKKTQVEINQGPPPELPQCFKDKILELAEGKNVSQPILVVQKVLHASDVWVHNNRFLVPTKQYKEFLYDHEKRSLPLINVRIIEPCLTIGTIAFDKWSIGPVLRTNWNQIVKRNKLELDMIMQLWAVRIDEELVFALVNVPGGITKDHNDASETLEKNNMEE